MTDENKLYESLEEENYYNGFQMLNEAGFLATMTTAAKVLGYANIAGLSGIGAAMIIKSAKKSEKLKKFLSKLFKGKKKEFEFNDINSNKGKREIQTSENYAEKLKDIIESIKNNDFDEAKWRWEKGNWENDERAVKVVALELTEKLGEPPLYVYPSGNKCYFACKQIMGIKTAKALADSVVSAMVKNKSYYDDMEVK